MLHKINENDKKLSILSKKGNNMLHKLINLTKKCQTFLNLSFVILFLKFGYPLKIIKINKRI
jgi:hypothetical protein